MAGLTIGPASGSDRVSRARGVTAEGDRIAGFGRLEDGLGAGHQTGWTGLIADVIRRGHGAVRETADLVGDLIDPLE